VARRVRIEAPDSALFTVRRQQGSGRAAAAADAADDSSAAANRADDDEGSILSSSKVAPGMEVSYTITFRPQSFGDASHPLVIATERERFVVPLIGAGAAAALDLPDQICFRERPPVRVPARQALLVRNVGAAAGSFSLAASGPFSVAPAQGYLAPGESLQVVVAFVPSGAGQWEGELEVLYGGTGRATHTQLVGQGRELAVGLSAGELEFLPTYMGRLSQKSVWVVNSSDRAVSFAFKQRASVEEDADAAAAGLAAAGGPLAASAQLPDGAVLLALPLESLLEAAAGLEDNGLPTERSDVSAAPSSGSGTSILADASLAAARETKRTRRDAAADPALFSAPFFAAFPPTGVVQPGGRVEVVVQFSPDEAREFTRVAFVEIDGREERVPLLLRGRGLGAVVCFAYESLDVGDVFVNTTHGYEVELMNRGKVDAEFRLQPSHTRCGLRIGGWPGLLQQPGHLPTQTNNTTPTLQPKTNNTTTQHQHRFGSKFSFQPEAGCVAPGATALIRVQLTSDALGSFDESFSWYLRGSSAPVAMAIRGRVIGPTFELDAREVGFGVVAFGFRHVRELLLTNTSAVPLAYNWRLLEDPLIAGGATGGGASGTAAGASSSSSQQQQPEFTVLPARGTVLPGGVQRIQIEFMPQVRVCVRVCMVGYGLAGGWGNAKSPSIF